MYGSWERISRLHTAHVLHMYHKSSLGSEPNTARRPTHVVLLVASASSVLGGGGPTEIPDRTPDVRRAPAAGPCAGPS